MREIALGLIGAVIVLAIGGLLYVVIPIIRWLDEDEQP